MITRPGVLWLARLWALNTRSSYIVVPEWASTAIERKAESASVVPVEKLVSISAWVANVETAIWSAAGLAFAKAVAAATASAIGLPLIDWERSTARTTLLAFPKLIGLGSATGLPFSSTVGGVEVGFEVTTVTRTRGYWLVSTPRMWTAAAAAAGSSRQAATTSARRRFIGGSLCRSWRS